MYHLPEDVQYLIWRSYYSWYCVGEIKERCYFSREMHKALVRVLALYYFHTLFDEFD